MAYSSPFTDGKTAYADSWVGQDPLEIISTYPPESQELREMLEKVSASWPEYNLDYQRLFLLPGGISAKLWKEGGQPKRRGSCVEWRSQELGLWLCSSHRPQPCLTWVTQRKKEGCMVQPTYAGVLGGEDMGTASLGSPHTRHCQIHMYSSITHSSKFQVWIGVKGDTLRVGQGVVKKAPWEQKKTKNKKTWIQGKGPWILHSHSLSYHQCETKGACAGKKKFAE